MKRLITALCVALALTAQAALAQEPITTPASPLAQQEPAKEQPTSPFEQKITLDFQSGDIAQIIQTLCSKQKVNCSIDPKITGTWIGNLSDVTLLRAVEVIAQSQRYTTAIRDSVLYVEPPVAAVAKTVADQDPIKTAGYQSLDPYSGSYRRPALDIMRDQPLPPSLPSPVAYNQGYGYYGDPYRGGYGYGGYGSYGQDPHYEAQRHRVEGAANTSWLKIYAQGDTDFVKSLLVMRRVGSTYVPACAGGKAFRSRHDPCEVPVGLNTYRFELRKGGKTQFYEEDIEMFSKYDHDHPFQYPISQEMFDSWENAEGRKRVETWKAPTAQTPPVPPTPPGAPIKQ